jgi:hypothetical protein
MKNGPDWEDTFEKVPTGYFTCDRIKHINPNVSFNDVDPGLRAGVQDGSGYYAALCVEDDFGCVLWEQRG